MLVHIMKKSTGLVKQQKRGVDLKLSYKTSWNFNGDGKLPTYFLHNCDMELLFICLSGCLARVAVH